MAGDEGSVGPAPTTQPAQQPLVHPVFGCTGARGRALGRASETELPGDAERLDLTHLACYSLDDAGTREIDDALSFERVTLAAGSGFTSLTRPAC